MASKRPGLELPTEPEKVAVIAEIGALSEETPLIISANNPAPVVEDVAESEPVKKEITAEKETSKSAITQTVKPTKPSASSYSEPCMGDVRVVNDVKQV